jgi:hypothetical protein
MRTPVIHRLSTAYPQEQEELSTVRDNLLIYIVILSKEQKNTILDELTTWFWNGFW